MRKINKNINIALIFMLIGAALCSDIAYSFDAACLRIPVGIAGKRTQPVLKDVARPGERILSDVESYYLRQKEKRAVYHSDSFDVPTGFLAAKCHQYVMGDVKRPPFELDPNLEAYMEHLGQLSNEALDREFVNVSGFNLVLSRCSYHDFSLVQYDSAGILKKGAIGQERERALKIVLIFGEWGRRYYRYERRYEHNILPGEFAVTRKLIDIISQAPRNGYDYKYEKEHAVEAAGITDEELNKQLEGLIGRKYDLRRHTCEDMFFDVYRPIMQELDHRLKMCQKGKYEESAYQKLQVDSRKIEILLEEWFCRHAWLQQDASLSLRLPLRKNNIEKAFCLEGVFEQNGEMQYFDLYRLGVYEIRNENSRDHTLVRFLKTLGVGKGALVIEIGSGRVCDWVKFAAIMGADAIASDVDKEAIKKAKRTVQKELLLRKDLLPSDRVKLREAYRRIKWIGGEAGDIAKLRPSKPAKIVIMEGFIDSVHPLGCFFGSIPIYSEEQIAGFLEKGYQFLGRDGYMLLSIFGRDKDEFVRQVNSFINSKAADIIKHDSISFPLADNSPWYSRHWQGLMFIIHTQRQIKEVCVIQLRTGL